LSYHPQACVPCTVRISFGARRTMKLTTEFRVPVPTQDSELRTLRPGDTMTRAHKSLTAISIALSIIVAGPVALAALAQTKSSSNVSVPDLKSDSSELRDFIERYATDRLSLARSYPVLLSPSRQTRLRQLYGDWLAALGKLNFDSLSLDAKVDYLLFRNHLEHELRQLDVQAKQYVEIEPLLPFSKTIVELEEARRRMDPIESPRAAMLLAEMKKQIDAQRKAIESKMRPDSKGGEKNYENAEGKGEPTRITKTQANRAVLTINGLRLTLRNWFTFYNGYDPTFTWWADEPYKSADQALAAYATFLGEQIGGLKQEIAAIDSSESRQAARTGCEGGGQRGRVEPAVTASARAADSSDIVGDPIGRDGLMGELEYEMIPYTPEELIAIAEKELAWCEQEMKKASRDLGYGDDWHKALEHVKTLYVDPGKQPELIRDLALEAIKFVDDHDLVTVP